MSNTQKCHIKSMAQLILMEHADGIEREKLIYGDKY